MNQELLTYYERELSYMRELGREFARDFPSVAGQLGLGASECSDPHVERLLEGFAFLTARIQLQIDAEFPRFTEQLLNLLYPHCLAPTPSMAIVSLKPDPRQTLPDTGFRVPRGTHLSIQQRSLPPTSSCRYRTAHDVQLWPLEITAVSHRPLSNESPAPPARAGDRASSVLEIRLRSLDGRPLKQLALDDLPLFIGCHDPIGRRVHDLCATATVDVSWGDTAAATRHWLGKEALAADGFDDEQALLPAGARTFPGHRLLQEYFALPDRFAFSSVRGLRRVIQAHAGAEAELRFLLDRHDPLVEAAITGQHIRLFCTPVINLFAQRADRIPLRDRHHEYQVIPDRTRPEALEVHDIIEVVARGPDQRRPFKPLYACTDSEPNGSAGQYTVHRRPRAPAAGGSAYRGSETFLGLVDAGAASHHPSLEQLSVTAWCTNRALPLTLRGAGTELALELEAAAPIREPEIVVRPSAPRDSQAWGDVSWRLIGHLSCDYTSTLADAGNDGAPLLRRLLELHADTSQPALLRLIAGVRSLRGEPIVRRLPGGGPRCFGRGVLISLACEEAAFEGHSLPLFGRVLAHFFARSAAINSLTELSLLGAGGREILRVPAVHDQGARA